MYLTLTSAEYGALQSLADADDVASVQLSRRDSLDNPMPLGGILVVSVVPRVGPGEDGSQHRVAIGETGSTVPW